MYIITCVWIKNIAYILHIRSRSHLKSKLCKREDNFYFEVTHIVLAKSVTQYNKYNAYNLVEWHEHTLNSHKPIERIDPQNSPIHLHIGKAVTLTILFLRKADIMSFSSIC